MPGIYRLGSIVDDLIADCERRTFSTVKTSVRSTSRERSEPFPSTVCAVDVMQILTGEALSKLMPDTVVVELHNEQ